MNGKNGRVLCEVMTLCDGRCLDKWGLGHGEEWVWRMEGVGREEEVPWGRSECYWQMIERERENQEQERGREDGQISLEGKSGGLMAGR